MTQEEYNKCVDLYSDRVYRFILKNVQNEADAQDVVQNSFIKMWQNYEKVEYEKARSFLFTVAYRDMIDQIRKTKRVSHTDALPENALGVTHSSTNQVKELIDRGLNTLSEIQRNVITLKDYEGYNYKEIGEITNLSESQVKVYIFRARKKLKEFLVSIDNVL